MTDADATDHQPQGKPAWRDQLRQHIARRAACPRQAAELATRFLACCPSATTILLYAATPDEAPTAELLAALWRDGVSVALPVILPGQQMIAYRVADQDELVADRFGILALPAALRTETRRIDPEQLDAVAVPGLGFDETTGFRLGRGAGYYDRFLARCPNAQRIGVAFDEQIVQGLPAEPHDIPMHAVVTPTRTLRFP